jgi:hypothetical protein
LTASKDSVYLKKQYLLDEDIILGKRNIEREHSIKKEPSKKRQKKEDV